MISTEKFGLWFMAPAEWNITLVVLFFNKCSGGKQIFTLSGKYWKLIRERGCWPGMPGPRGRTGGIIVPIMMIVMMDVVTRPWHYGTGGYTGHATAASTLYTASDLSRSGHAVLAASTHHSPASGLGIIQIHTLQIVAISVGDHSLSWFLVTLSRSSRYIYGTLC